MVLECSLPQTAIFESCHISYNIFPCRIWRLRVCVSAGHKGLFKRASLIYTASVRTVILLSRCITTPWQGNSFSNVHATSVRCLCNICPICPTATQREEVMWSWVELYLCVVSLETLSSMKVSFFLCAAKIWICVCAKSKLSLRGGKPWHRVLTACSMPLSISHSKHFILSHLSCPWEEVHCRL